MKSRLMKWKDIPTVSKAQEKVPERRQDGLKKYLVKETRLGE